MRSAAPTMIRLRISEGTSAGLPSVSSQASFVRSLRRSLPSLTILTALTTMWAAFLKLSVETNYILFLPLF